MSPAAAYARYERALADCLRAADPVAALRAARAGAPPPLARALAQVDEDGLRLSALLVARLRFERLLQGSARAAAWFEADAAGFTERFRRYHQEVAPRSFFPLEEAQRFEVWSGSVAE